jgi:nicotinate-nucleotide adenylyltransferase
VRIGVFGGSFDPIHHAHLIVARLAIEQLALDRVLFLVAGAQPFKQGIHAATAAHRLRMVELGLEGIPDCIADGRELRRPPPSYTVDSLRELKREEPSAELVLIMGADVAGGLGGWREPDEVRRLATIAVCRRMVNAGVQVGAGHAHPGSPSAGAEIDVPAIDISSTAVRLRAAAGLPLTGWVPLAVADYIVASQLYRSPRG